MSQSEYKLPATLICPHCHGANAPANHVCVHCFTPLDSFAATDPMASIFAEMDTLGKAARNPSYPIVVVGMWLLLGPAAVFAVWMALVGLVGLGEMIRDRSVPLDLGALVLLPAEILFCAGACAVFGTLLYRTTRNYLRQRAEERGAADDDSGARPRSS